MFNNGDNDNQLGIRVEIGLECYSWMICGAVGCELLWNR